MTQKHENEIRKTIESALTDTDVDIDFQVVAYIELMEKIGADIRTNNHLSIVTRLAYECYYDMPSARLSLDWKKAYFEILEKYLCASDDVKKKLSFTSLMTEVGADGNSIQPSFISKLLHTVRRDEPIYDSKVRMFLETGDAAGEIVEERKVFAVDIYEKKIRTFYRDDKCSDLRTLMLDAFDEKYGWKYSRGDMTDTKRLDFVCWALGKQGKKISEFDVERT